MVKWKFWKKKAEAISEEHKQIEAPKVEDVLTQEELSSVIIDKPKIINRDNDKLDLIHAELKSLFLLLRKHDQNLQEHDERNIEYISELLVRKKIIPEAQKEMAEDIIKEAIESNKERKEVIEELKEAGLSQATAYRYTKDISKKEESKIIIRDNEKTEDNDNYH